MYSIINIKKKPTEKYIPKDVLKVINDSARGSGTIDYCELCAFDYCNSLVDGTKTFLSELDFQTHYNKTIGAKTSEKSIPDGTILTETGDIHQISTFHLPIVHELYVCRKILKLIQVALSEWNPETSLLSEKFPELKIQNIKLYFCMFIPEKGKLSKIKNVIKKIYNGIKKFIPEFIEINYNIFQTSGECEKLFWYNDSGICFYQNPRLCKQSKLIYTITDIREILLKFLDEKDNDFFIPDTILSKYYEIMY